MLTIAAKKKHRGIKLNPVERVGMAVVYLICIMAGILTIVPFLYIVAGSFATEKELVERAFFIIPHTFSLNAYKYIIADGSIFRGLANSFFIMIAGTVVNMAFTTTLAYPLSKSNLKGRNVVLNVIIVTMLFSGGMIPNYLVVKGLGLLDNSTEYHKRANFPENIEFSGISLYSDKSIRHHKNTQNFNGN